MKMAALRGPKMMVHIVNKNENALKSIILQTDLTPGKLTRKATVTETIMQTVEHRVTTQDPTPRHLRPPPKPLSERCSH